MASGIPFQHIAYVSSCFRVYCDSKIIDTVVTTQREVVERWANEILLAHASDPKVMVGLDIKRRSKKTKGHFKDISGRKTCIPDYNYGKEIATMQLCIDTKCLIIQLVYISEIPQSFKNFLMNPKFTFMGVDEDVSKLVSERRLDFAKTADFRAASINKWPRKFKQHDLKYLAKQIAGFDINIPDQDSLTEWDSKVLDNNHVQRACIAAYASYKIANVILAEK